MFKPQGIDELLQLLLALPYMALKYPQTAKLLAGTVRDTFVEIKAMAAAVSTRPGGELAPPPAIVLDAAAEGEAPKPVDGSVADFTTVCSQCIERVAYLLGEVSTAMDIEFVANDAALILVEVLGDVAGDLHYDKKLRESAVAILIAHIGWGTLRVGITKDRIRAYELLAGLHANTGHTFVWPKAEPEATKA